MKEATNSQKWIIVISIALTTLALGPAALGIYTLLTSHWPALTASIAANWLTVAQVCATFSFTTLGVLAALITLLFAFSSTAAFRRFQRRGHLDILFRFYYFVILCTVGTAFLSIWNLSGELLIGPFRVLLMLLVSNIAQVAVVIWMICGLAMKAERVHDGTLPGDAGRDSGGGGDE